MMENRKVSIITPSYNCSGFIAETIGSVLAQTYKDWEMIIVDDCSTDDSVKVITPFLSDERIRLFCAKKNQGAALCRNEALRHATGKWVTFLDSDDIWLPEKLERQVAFMTENGYAFSYHEYAEMAEDGKALGVRVSGPGKITRCGMYAYCWPGCLTVMYDAQEYGLLQIDDIKKNNDYAMWLKLAEKYDCYLLKENLAMYRRQRSGSISNQGYLCLIKWHYRLFRDAQHFGPVKSFALTMQNMVFGIVKKLIYVKRYDEAKVVV